ncbi:unnamed protein product [Prorocentrum cordatum]|uniref:Ribosome biogenesis protein NOP53 n=1 Tax=Prorocentrum cordatum TaxID=2364126 RepID=A0ABN9UKE0_9DINO|nr:unnamed protein product [Polarella glacialis]
MGSAPLEIPVSTSTTSYWCSDAHTMRAHELRMQKAQRVKRRAEPPGFAPRSRRGSKRRNDDEAQEEGQEEGRENDQLVDEAQRVDRPVGAVLFSQVAPLGSRRRLQELDGALLPSLEAICICLQPGPPSPCLFSHRAAGLSTLTSLSGLAGRSRWHSRGPKKWPPARAEVEEKPRASQNHGVGGPGAGPASPEAPNSID